MKVKSQRLDFVYAKVINVEGGDGCEPHKKHLVPFSSLARNPTALHAGDQIHSLLPAWSAAGNKQIS